MEGDEGLGKAGVAKCARVLGNLGQGVPCPEPPKNWEGHSLTAPKNVCSTHVTLTCEFSLRI